MRLQELLLTMLADTFEVERVGPSDFTLKPQGRPLVSITATERDLVEFATRHASDGLMALGAVGDDDTGTVAAIALLSVHVDEAIEATGGDSLRLLTVTGAGLEVHRNEPGLSTG